MAKPLLRSFAGGEITPEMFGRLDLPKFQTGLRLARNFIILPHGPAARRPGTYLVNEVKDAFHRVRILPFVFSATQSAVLELGENYVRIHTSTGTLLEAAQNITAISQANPGVITYAGADPVNDDWVYLTGIGGMTPLNGRFVKVSAVNAGANTFQMLDPIGANIDTSAMPAFTSGGTMARVYTVATPYLEANLFGIHYAQDSDVLTLCHPLVEAKELRRLGATNWTLTGASFAATIAAPTGVSATPTIPTATNPTTQSYKVTAVASDGVTESVASSAATASNNLTIAGNFNTIAWSAAAGAARYYVYKLRGGSYGFIGQTTGLSIIDDNILADTTTTPPENASTLNSGVGEYPRAVTHLERRRWFAGTENAPQNIWATRNATTSNLTSSVPQRDDDALEFRIAAQQQNAIQHLMPLNDLVALTVGGEFRIFADGGPALTFSTLSVKPQGFSGASDVQPALAVNAVLFVQALGARINELTYDQSGTGSMRALDVSMLAPHLFDGYTVVALAFQRAPEPILWAVRSDGVLLGMTYKPDQQVFAWHQHETAGLVESVAVVPENNRDALYLVVKRTIAGASRRFIERMAPRFFATQADAYFVDGGLSYDGVPVTQLSGLWHLEGEEVVAWADGAVVTGLTVVDGGVTLPDAASKVQVGLSFTSDLQTLPQAYDGAPGGGQATMKNPTNVTLRVRQSTQFKVGPSFDRLAENRAHPIGLPIPATPALTDGEIEVHIQPRWDADGSVCVRVDTPSPLTVVSMVVETATGG